MVGGGGEAREWVVQGGGRRHEEDGLAKNFGSIFLIHAWRWSHSRVGSKHCLYRRIFRGGCTRSYKYSSYFVFELYEIHLNYKK